LFEIIFVCFALALSKAILAFSISVIASFVSSFEITSPFLTKSPFLKLASTTLPV
jgi:hypothetical protein